MLAEPLQQVGVEAHGHDGFGGGQHDLGVFPEGFVGGMSFRVGLDAVANGSIVRSTQLAPVSGGGSASGGAPGLRGFASSGVFRGVPSARPR